jgi:Domain of unknown function (DUF222)
MGYSHEEWAQGGALDVMAPSAELVAQFEAARGSDGGFAGCSDEELAGVIGRIAACEPWLAARKAGAVAELVKRRKTGAGERRRGLPELFDDSVTEELMPALGISRRQAQRLVDFSLNLTGRLDATYDQMLAGNLDFIKARIISDATCALDDERAVKAEKLALKRSGGSFAGKTPGELEKIIARAATAADPESATRRRERSEAEGRVESWNDPDGTVTLAARGVNPAEAAAAEQILDETARVYKKAGLGTRLDRLRLRALVDKVLGRDPLGKQAAGLRADVNLTLPVFMLPLLTVLGLADNPGEAGRAGIADPDLVRRLAAAAAAAGDRSRWHLTLVDDLGRPVSHGCQNGVAGMNPGKTGTPVTISLPAETGDGKVTFQMHPIPLDGDCDHRFEVPGHDPSPLLRHLVHIRDGSCVEPGCARSAVRCDFEHSVPFEEGGRTCLCNGNSKCRRGHGIKQRKNWVAIQIGSYTTWHTPSGRTYTTGPRQYPF